MEKKIVVDEGGNKRQEISQEDIKQALNDITEWFKSNGASHYKAHLEENTGVPE